jgi:chemotaxis protein MotB
MTLLLAFFVVMYAISSVNAGKYRVLSDSLFAAFRGAPRTMEPIQVGDKQVGSGADMQTTVVQQSVLEGRAQSRLAPVPVEVGLSRSSGVARTAPKLPAQAAAAAAALSRLADQVERAMSDLVRKDMITIRRNDFWIEVEMRTDILFPSGSARLAPGATDIIQRLGSVLSPFPNPVRVEGHTDNVPIKTALFSSNWELSAARAGSVVRVLADHGVEPGRLAVIGYGEQRPVQVNTTAQGRNANRRVLLVILSTELMRQKDPSDPSSVSVDSSADSQQSTAGQDGRGNPPGAGGPAGAGSRAGAGGPVGLGSPAGADGRGPAGIADPPGPNATPSPGGATASPDDSPQAIPTPGVDPSIGAPPAQTAARVTPSTEVIAVAAANPTQHNTGMEAAP